MKPLGFCLYFSRYARPARPARPAWPAWPARPVLPVGASVRPSLFLAFSPGRPSQASGASYSPPPSPRPRDLWWWYGIPVEGGKNLWWVENPLPPPPAPRGVRYGWVWNPIQESSKKNPGWCDLIGSDSGLPLLYLEETNDLDGLLNRQSTRFLEIIWDSWSIPLIEDTVRIDGRIRQWSGCYAFKARIHGFGAGWGLKRVEPGLVWFPWQQVGASIGGGGEGEICTGDQCRRVIKQKPKAVQVDCVVDWAVISRLSQHSKWRPQEILQTFRHFGLIATWCFSAAVSIWIRWASFDFFLFLLGYFSLFLFFLLSGFISDSMGFVFCFVIRIAVTLPHAWNKPTLDVFPFRLNSKRRGFIDKKQMMHLALVALIAAY